MIPPALGDPKSDSNALADDAMILGEAFDFGPQ